MLSTFALALAAVVFISLISLSGILVLLVNQKFLSKLIYYLVSFAIGTLLGSVWWHLIPQAYQSITSPQIIGGAVLAGLFAFLILEKIIRHNHCHQVDCRQKPTGWLILISDGLHNFLDGVLIGAAFMTGQTLGWITVIAIAGHEIAQEIGDFSILLHSGFSPAKALFFNFLSALTALLGVILVFVVGSTNMQPYLIYIIPVTAGGFLYIALSDLVPELHQNKHTPVSHFGQVFLIFVGLFVMFMLK
ncbi:MAG: ZIP family metal transporter [bacterium]|nr:ZIP family metal transporter [bacterium]